MIDIAQIFFEYDDKDDKNKLSILARNTVRDEIQNTKMRNDFYRYLSWRIQIAPSKKKIMHRYKNFYVTTFTNESWVLIEKFIEYAVEVFNYSHPSTETTVATTTELTDVSEILQKVTQVVIAYVKLRNMKITSAILSPDGTMYEELKKDRSGTL